MHGVEVDVTVGARGIDFDRGGLTGFEIKKAERKPAAADGGGWALVEGRRCRAVSMTDYDSGVARAVFVRCGGEPDFVAAVGRDREREGGGVAGAAGV